ncbi:Retrovirus-related Pol polyprotein from transposon TNT 1-94 [Cucumis melo var. makuwa]|uniref:Retrovirus-related Pol polyprotein from transposon TNT 1-94 n=1 Tax=Cucumis melo var. makuwa TaxID=1194695 RepID=A0A5A7UIY6_CUCMM|nr:Retrovirus-related Pol polyprotein from transposon TNT 1-94 [Cucumis melo var. makuwa]TYK22727.1 Retrovirus-related Pol polyprotein from transposon TNT 1-94 [Cucumis melo var. makuwa]
MINCKPATTPMNVNEKLQQNDGAEMANAQRDHFGAAKRVMRYIGGTIEYGIWYYKVSDFKLCGFTDSDWASSLDDKRKAEYAAATSAACQAIWLQRMLTELQHEQEGATVIFCDNKATISRTKNLTFHSRTKHIDIRFHFIRDLVAKEEVSLTYCSTHEQWADILIKALSKEKFCYFRAMMGIRKFESRGSIED